MKKCFAAILAVLLLMTSLPAWAETVDIWDVEVGKIIRLENGTMIDMDLDGNDECVSLEILQEYGYDTGYRLTVGDASIDRDGFYMESQVYLLKLTRYAPPMLLVCDYGPSDDYATYFHVYENGEVAYIGTVDSLAEDMSVCDGIITTDVRANVLYTWYRTADFTLAHSSGIDYTTGDGTAPIEYAMYEIPRYLYPMGLIVTARVDLPLYAGMNDRTECGVISAGSKLILVATDDRQWVYVQSMDDRYLNGWVEVIGEFGMECRVGNQIMYSDEVFEGLLFAD